MFTCMNTTPAAIILVFVCAKIKHWKKPLSIWEKNKSQLALLILNAKVNWRTRLCMCILALYQSHTQRTYMLWLLTFYLPRWEILLSCQLLWYLKKKENLSLTYRRHVSCTSFHFRAKGETFLLVEENFQLPTRLLPWESGSRVKQLLHAHTLHPVLDWSNVTF